MLSTIRSLLGMVFFSAGLVLGTVAPLSAQEVPWRYDYSAARREAKEKNKPLVLDFGTENCFYCKKLDANTFRDPGVVKALTERFIPVKIDGGKDAVLAQALGINRYPTLVFAAPNGKILGQQDGYVEAAQFRQQLDRLQADAGQQAAPAVAATDTNVPKPDRAKRAQELLSLAKEEFRVQNDAGGLERCRALTTDYSDLPEGAEAKQLTLTIKNDPQRMAQACEKLTDALGETYLELAESLLKKGESQQAASCLEKAIRLCSGTRPAQLAQERLLEVRNQLTRQPDAKGVLRGVSP